MKVNINHYLRAIIIRQAGDNSKLAIDIQENLSKESKLLLIRLIENLELKNQNKNSCG
jgi:hypothetical protein